MNEKLLWILSISLVLSSPSLADPGVREMICVGESEFVVGDPLPDNGSTLTHYIDRVAGRSIQCLGRIFKLNWHTPTRVLVAEFSNSRRERNCTRVYTLDLHLIREIELEEGTSLISEPEGVLYFWGGGPPGRTAYLLPDCEPAWTISPLYDWFMDDGAGSWLILNKSDYETRRKAMLVTMPGMDIIWENREPDWGYLPWQNENMAVTDNSHFYISTWLHEWDGAGVVVISKTDGGLVKLIEPENPQGIQPLLHVDTNTGELTVLWGTGVITVYSNSWEMIEIHDERSCVMRPSSSRLQILETPELVVFTGYFNASQTCREPRQAKTILVDKHGPDRQVLEIPGKVCLGSDGELIGEDFQPVTLTTGRH